MKMRKRIDLALQGGGSHGAFTWGVLDRLLADERIDIEAISGTSAGAINATVMAFGMAHGGRDGARAALAQFWRALSDATRGSFLRRTPFQAWTGAWSLDQSPFLAWLDLLSTFASPYDLNPLNYNPLREILVDQVDFTQLREIDTLQLFVTATNVETGQPRVFRREQLTADHIMASACLPNLYQAVIIDGVPYWDGGYMGNPSLWPLFDSTESNDILIVKINPIERKGVPHTTREIIGRLNEITFNASLLREFRAIDFVQRLFRAGRLDGTAYNDVRIHIVGDDELMNSVSESSKFLTEWPFLEMLRDKGGEAAETWLETHYEDLGKRSTVNLRRMFQGGEDALDGRELTPPASNEATP
ncbi:MAG TPA: patatin-like phospholipase family protein [Caulobacterales bacterium]|nr:patatin-like phospholipase family protein [Caulobacterales bacterium]